MYGICPIKLFQFFKYFRSIVDNPKTIDACVPGDAFAVLFKMIGNGLRLVVARVYKEGEGVYRTVHTVRVTAVCTVHDL